jgi:uncharacterized protein YjiS (DUF1127 family)
MRDYIRHQATFRDHTYAFPNLRRVIRSWLAKRQLRRLELLDDYILHDIGLTRDDLRQGLRLPRDMDPIAEVMAYRDGRLPRGGRHK